MKITYASLFLAAALPAFAQKTGDPVTPDALGKLEWVQGSAPTAWEPGKLYVLECWATWCGPCIAAIPHVDGLYDKYQEKGLRVIGVNVWEDGKDKVGTFVKEKGDGMSYPVAYTGKGGAFESEWLKPAGVRGIPHAFVVKDGKVLLTTHPMQLTEPVIEGLLAGGDAEKKAIDGIKNAQANQEAVAKAAQAFRQAAVKKDVPAMETALADMKKADPEARTASMLELDLLIAKGDWTAAESSLAKLATDPSASMIVASTAHKLTQQPDAPESFRKAVATSMTKHLEKTGHPVQFQILAKLQWSLGDKDAAKAAAKGAVEWIKAPENASSKLPVAPFEKFSDALEQGELPTDEQMTGWLRESMPSNARPAATITPKEK